MTVLLLIAGVVGLGLFLSTPSQPPVQSIIIVAHEPTAPTFSGGMLLILLALMLLLALVFA